MRDDREIDRAIELVEEQIDTTADEDDPLVPVLLSYYQARRAGLLTVRDTQAGQHWEALDRLKASLATDMPLPEFVQTMAMISAIEWAEEV